MKELTLQDYMRIIASLDAKDRKPYEIANLIMETKQRLKQGFLLKDAIDDAKETLKVEGVID